MSGVRMVRGRLATISVPALMVVGAWQGALIGLFIGALLGAVLVWLAGAFLDWERQLSITLGVDVGLLPFGDQLGLLETVQDRWYLAVPVVGLALALVGAIVGTLSGGLLAASYNRLPERAHVGIEIMLPEERGADDGSPPAIAEMRRSRPGLSRSR